MGYLFVLSNTSNIVGIRQTESDVALFIREELHGRHAGCDYTAKDIDPLWEKIRLGMEWKERFGTSAESVMGKLRG